MDMLLMFLHTYCYEQLRKQKNIYINI